MDNVLCEMSAGTWPSRLLTAGIKSIGLFGHVPAAFKLNGNTAVDMGWCEHENERVCVCVCACVSTCLSGAMLGLLSAMSKISVTSLPACLPAECHLSNYTDDATWAPPTHVGNCKLKTKSGRTINDKLPLRVFAIADLHVLFECACVQHFGIRLPAKSVRVSEVKLNLRFTDEDKVENETCSPTDAALWSNEPPPKVKEQVHAGAYMRSKQV